MSRISAYIISSKDLLSLKKSIQTKEMVEFTLKNKKVMTQILVQSLRDIHLMAEKHGVSQFTGKSDKWVGAQLKKLAGQAYTEYLNLVKNGGSLKEQQAFVRLFSKGRNLQAIKAATKTA